MKRLPLHIIASPIFPSKSWGKTGNQFLLYYLWMLALAGMTGWFITCMFAYSVGYAASNVNPAITTPIPIDDIAEFKTYSPTVRALILKARDLSQKNLTYMYGSADPKNGGMDCSGTMYYLLTEVKLKDVSRSSEGLFQWVKEKGNLHKVTVNDFNSSEFSQLKPGDLLFWSGTYNTSRPGAISHTMMYLGENKNGKRLMFGSSDGRTYQGKKMWGVSVFDFNLPNGKGAQKFEGYSCIPDLTCK